MSMLSSFLFAAGLSMDNLAVTVSAGCAKRPAKCTHTIVWVSALFAVAHFVMFSIGFEGGVLLHAGQTIAPWLACLILMFIGGGMIKEAFEPQEENCPALFNSTKTQVLLAVVTSIDALWAGAGLAFTDASFWQTVLILIGCVFVTSLFGFEMGHLLGRKFGRNMEVLGGSVLIFLGVKVLLEGMGIW